jgi:hypothetical protein
LQWTFYRHHSQSAWWQLALPIVLHPCQWGPSPPLHAYPMFATKFKGKAPISEWWVDKMGGSAARGQIRSKTSTGEGWLGVLEEKLEEGFEQFHGLYLFDLVDDDQE